MAIAAQGFNDRRPTGAVSRRLVDRVFSRIGLLQIDSVNVLARSHYLPLFSRLGPYPRALLDTMAYRDIRLFEYWSHEQSLLPVEDYPLTQWRMARARDGEMWHGIYHFSRQQSRYIDAVLAEVAAQGPLAASDLSDPGQRQGPWWGWNQGKRALEWLHWTGQVAALRRPSFERVYDLAERVIPAPVRRLPVPTEEEARRQLLLRAAAALGVATAADLADYHRQKLPPVRPLLQEMVADGSLLPVRVEGWDEPAYVRPDGRVPRRADARALLSPFDSLVWFRPRVERLFDFHLRIEIYTPAHRRTFGYYVLPFLLGDRLVGRIDLKADRKASVLRAQAVHGEPGVADGDGAMEVAAAMTAELASMANWLELDGVEVSPRGDLAPAMRRVAGAGAS